MKKTLICAAVAAVMAPSAWATNGMNMEGYGPIATAMGGASFAYDNGNAGIINNPATLGFMASGTSRLDLAIGGLHPSVDSQGQGSGAKGFYMPAVGYTRKDGNVSWGVGMMAQGGMGTDYPNGSFFGGVATFGTGSDAASGAALRNMSEVGVGRVIFPLAVNVNDRFTIGGSVDYVWAGMDIKWLVDGAHFGDMMPGYSNKFGAMNGSLVSVMQANMGAGAGQISGLSWGYFDFEKGGQFSQSAKGAGWAGNIGFTFKASDKLSIGGIYHAKTAISDLTTSDTGATLSMNVFVNGTGNTTVPVLGKISVRNFQWPETYGLGMSYQADDRWQFAADYKRINWAGVMKDFNMTFTAADASLQQPGMARNFVLGGGTIMNLQYYQNWQNQNVFMLGAAYKYSDPLTLRFGVNIANNPVPGAYVTPLFPAIETNHVMGGFGYAVDKSSAVNFSATYAPKVTVTNNWAAVAGNGGGSNQTISHSQTNWQLMYSKRF